MNTKSGLPYKFIEQVPNEKDLRTDWISETKFLKLFFDNTKKFK